jgi:tetratricopeptide (TPR) repeat protein
LKIARRSQAQALVLGSFAAVGGRVRVEARLHEAGGGRLIGADVVVADSVNQILTQVDVLAVKLASRLGVVLGEAARSRRLVDVTTDNLEAYRYYALAVERSRALQSRDAIELLQKAVALDPQFAMAYARIGHAYTISLSYPDLAKPYLEKAFQLSARLTDKDRASIAAWYAIASGDFEDAIARYRALIERYPDEAEAYVRLGGLLAAEGRPEEARDALQRGLGVDPDNRALHNGLGGAYLYMGRSGDAIAAYQRYVALAPDEPNAHDSLGLGYQWAGRYADAIAEYERAIALDPHFEIAVVHLGNVYFQMGRYRDAQREYRRYVEVADYDQERARGTASIARVHLDRGELADAWVFARRTLKWQPTAEAVLVALARGDRAAAESLIARLSDPVVTRGARASRRVVAYLRGRLALAQGRRDAALGHFREALRQPPMPYNIDSFEDCLAAGYLELGRLDEAVAEYERILRLHPHLATAYDDLSRALERRGDRDRARAELVRFLQVWKDADADAPRVVEARRRLAALNTAR